MNINGLKKIILLLLLLSLVAFSGCTGNADEATEGLNTDITNSTDASDDIGNPASSVENNAAGTPTEPDTSGDAANNTESGSSEPSAIVDLGMTRIAFNETNDGENGLFYLGQSYDDVFAILNSLGIDTQNIEQIENTNDLDAWNWGYTVVYVTDFGLSFVFDLALAVSDIYTLLDADLRISRVSQMGLAFGDSYERMVELYGDGYVSFQPEYWVDGTIIFEYDFGTHYFRVFTINGEVVSCGIGAYSYDLLDGYNIVDTIYGSIVQ